MFLLYSILINQILYLLILVTLSCLLAAFVRVHITIGYSNIVCWKRLIMFFLIMLSSYITQITIVIYIWSYLRVHDCSDCMHAVSPSRAAQFFYNLALLDCTPSNRIIDEYSWLLALEYCLITNLKQQKWVWSISASLTSKNVTITITLSLCTRLKFWIIIYDICSNQLPHQIFQILPIA